MITEFSKGIPIDKIEIPLVDVAVLLVAKGHTSAVVQFQDPAGNYAAAPANIALYERQGISPTQAPTGFVMGQNGTVVFSRQELDAGVEIINYTNGAACKAVVQYYRNG